MVTDRKLSQVTFDKIQHQLHEMKKKPYPEMTKMGGETPTNFIGFCWN